MGDAGDAALCLADQNEIAGDEIGFLAACVGRGWAGYGLEFIS